MHIIAKGENCELIYNDKTFSGHVGDIVFKNKRTNNNLINDDEIHIGDIVISDLFTDNATIDDHEITYNEFLLYNLLLKRGFDKETCDIIKEYMIKRRWDHIDFYTDDVYFTWINEIGYDTRKKLMRFFNTVKYDWFNTKN